MISSFRELRVNGNTNQRGNLTITGILDQVFGSSHILLGDGSGVANALIAKLFWDTGAEGLVMEVLKQGSAYKNFYIAPRGGNVAIGLGSGEVLGHKLAVSGDSIFYPYNGGAFEVTSLSNLPVLRTRSNDGNVLFTVSNSSSANRIYSVPVNQNLVLGAASTETLTLHSGGNVGIGTSVPNNKVHISGGGLEINGPLTVPLGKAVTLSQEAEYAQLQSYAKPLLINYFGNNTSLNSSAGSVTIGATGLTVHKFYVTSAAAFHTALIENSSSTPGANFGLQISAGLTAGDRALSVTTRNSVDALIVNGDGAVMINTTTSTQRLDVNGNIACSGLVISGSRQILASETGQFAPAGGTGTFVTSAQTGNFVTVRDARFLGFTSNVGVGGTLAVTGNISCPGLVISGSRQILASETGQFAPAGGTGNFVSSSQTGEFVTVRDARFLGFTNNVGVGGSLLVSGDLARVEGNSKIIFGQNSDSASNTLVAKIQWDTGAEGLVMEVLKQGSAYKNFYIAPRGGNVAIGLGSGEVLGHKLAVSGDSIFYPYNGGAFEVTSLSNLPVLRTRSNDGNVLFTVSNSSSANRIYSVPVNQNLVLGAASTETLTLHSGGNVGIGTSVPNNKVHISGGGLEINGPLTVPLGKAVTLSQEAEYAQLQSYAKPLLINYFGNNTSLNSSAGSVTIGATGLTVHKFYVTSAAAFHTALIENSSSTPGANFGLQISAGLTAGDRALSVTTRNSVDALIVNGDGAVMINTTTSTQRLDVNGNIACSGLVISGSRQILASETGQFAPAGGTGTFVTSAQTGNFVTVRDARFLGFTSNVGVGGTLAVTGNISCPGLVISGSRQILASETGQFVADAETGNFVTVRDARFLGFTSNVGVGGTLAVTGNISCPGLVISGSRQILASETGQFAPAGGTGTFVTSGQTGNFVTVRDARFLGFTSNVGVGGSLVVTGNVGIGVADPAYKLDINGTARVSGHLLAGDSTNALHSGASFAAVIGGYRNYASGGSSVVLGGNINTGAGNGAVILGGAENSVFSADCSILGGFQNTIFDKIGTAFSAIVQGQSNSIYRDYSFIGAGRTNVSSGRFSAIIGGESNLASGDYTFAAGVKSRAIHPGAFVLSDSRDMIKNSPTGDSLSLYFQSGVYVTGGAGADLYVEGRTFASLGLVISGSRQVLASETGQFAPAGGTGNFVSSSQTGEFVTVRDARFLGFTSNVGVGGTLTVTGNISCPGLVISGSRQILASETGQFVADAETGNFVTIRDARFLGFTNNVGVGGSLTVTGNISCPGLVISGSRQILASETGQFVADAETGNFVTVRDARFLGFASNVGVGGTLAVTGNISCPGLVISGSRQILASETGQFAPAGGTGNFVSSSQTGEFVTVRDARFLGFTNNVGVGGSLLVSGDLARVEGNSKIIFGQNSDSASNTLVAKIQWDTGAEGLVMEVLKQGSAYKNFYIAPRGGNVAIGLGSGEVLGHKLAVSGDSILYPYNGGAFEVTSLSNLPVLRTRSNDGNVLFTVSNSSSANRIYSVPVNQNLVLGAASTETLTLHSGGNVGIGNSTPQYKLDVTLADNTYASFGNVANVTSGHFGGIHLGYKEDSTNAYRKTALVYEGTSDAHARGKFHVLMNNATGTGSAALADAKLTVLSDGRVGIGTVNPKGQLHVSYTAQDTHDSLASSLDSFLAIHQGGNVSRLISSVNSGPVSSSFVVLKSRGTPPNPLIVNSGDVIGSFEFQAYDGVGRRTAAQILGIVDGAPESGNTPGRLAFYTTPSGSSSSPTERLRIDKDGNVGINTTNPLQRLDITGNIACSGLVISGSRQILASETGQFAPAGGTGNFVSSSQTGEFVTVRDARFLGFTSNVGVGGSLTVTGNISCPGLVISGSRQILASETGQFVADAETGNFVTVRDARFLGFTSNVGVGGSLTVTGNISCPGLVISGSRQILASETGQFVADAETGNFVTVRDARFLGFTSNVGVGGTLAVTGNISCPGLVISGSRQILASETGQFAPAGGTGTFVTSAQTGNFVTVRDARFLGFTSNVGVGGNLSVTGDIGIGTGTSAAKLDVNGTSIFRDTVTLTQPTAITFQNGQTIRDNSAGGLRIQVPLYKLQLDGGTDPTNGLVEIKTSGLVRMTVTNSGNVGINTTSPSEMLEVVGNILINKAGSDKYLSFGNGTAKIQSSNSNGNLDFAGGTSSNLTYRFWKSSFSSVLAVLNYTGLSLGGIGGGVGAVNALDIIGAAAQIGFGAGTVAPALGLIVNGSVGIGVADPAYKLDINGTARVSGHLLAGDSTNALHSGASFAAVIGGYRNYASGGSSVVLGGNINTGAGNGAVILGGAENSVFSADCSILGGFQNTIFDKIGTAFSAIVQGQSNSIYRDYSFIGAGRTNVSSGRFSAIIGGESNLASGDYTFAAGVKSRAIHPGAFVLSDSRDMIKNSPTGDSLSLYFQSGVYVTGGAGADLYVEGRTFASLGLVISGSRQVLASETGQFAPAGGTGNFVSSSQTGEFVTVRDARFLGFTSNVGVGGTLTVTGNISCPGLVISGSRQILASETGQFVADAETGNFVTIRDARFLGFTNNVGVGGTLTVTGNISCPGLVISGSRQILASETGQFAPAGGTGTFVTSAQTGNFVTVRDARFLGFTSNVGVGGSLTVTGNISCPGLVISGSRQILASETGQFAPAGGTGNFVRTVDNRALVFTSGLTLGTTHNTVNFALVGQFNAQSHFLNYTKDGVWNTGARYCSIATPGNGSLRFGYHDDAAGQYTPSIGFEIKGSADQAPHLLILQTRRISGSSIEPFNMWQVSQAGEIRWGSGTIATDTNLYRSSGNHLRTNSNFQVDGTVRLSTNSGGFSVGVDAGQSRIDTLGAGAQIYRFFTGDAFAGIRTKAISVGANYGDLDAPIDGLIVEGNVGIGTSVPNNKVHISGGGLEINGPLTVPLGKAVTLSQEAEYAQLQSYAKPLLINYFGNNTSLNSSAGSVTIGATGLTVHKFYVTSAAAFHTALIENSSSTPGANFGLQISAGLTAGDRALSVTTRNSVDALIVNGDGAVMINTTTSTQRLDVNGNIACSGLVISGSRQILASETGQFAPAGGTGNFVSSSQTGEFVTVRDTRFLGFTSNVGVGGSLTVTGNISCPGLVISGSRQILASETGQFVADAETGNFVTVRDARFLGFTSNVGVGGSLTVTGNISCPGLVISGSRQILASETGQFAPAGGTGSFVTSAQTGNFVTVRDARFLGFTSNIGVGGTLVVTGNVGIGITNPQSKLHVSGGGLSLTDLSGAVSPSSIGSYLLQGYQNTTSAFGIGADANFVYFQSFGSKPLILNNQGNPIYLCPGNSNVGVGTSSPQVKLDVSGVIASSGLSISGSRQVLASETGQFAPAGGTGTFVTSAQTGDFVTVRDARFLGFTNNVGVGGALVVTGNVGIITNNPLSNLQIGTLSTLSTSSPITLSLGGTYSSTAGINPKLKVWEDANSAYGLGVSPSQLEFMVPATARFAWFINSGEKMRMDTNGNLLLISGAIGIGTTVPDAKLEINNSGDSHLFITNTTAGTAASPNTFGIRFRGYGKIEKSAIYATDESTNFNRGNLLFYTQNNAGILSEKMRVSHDGSVGINTTNPLQRLDVSGYIASSGLVISGSRQILASETGQFAPAGGTGNFVSSSQTGEFVTVRDARFLGFTNNVGVGGSLTVTGNISCPGLVISGSRQILASETGQFVADAETGNFVTVRDARFLGFTNNVGVGGSLTVTGNISCPGLVISGSRQILASETGQFVADAETGNFVTVRDARFLGFTSNVGVGGTLAVTGNISCPGLVISGSRQILASETGQFAPAGGTGNFVSSSQTGEFVTIRDARFLGFTSNVGVGGSLVVTGNVGIGVADPAYKLDINGTARVSGHLLAGDSTNALHSGASFAAVIGGYRNYASGGSSVVLGGNINTGAGNGAVILGGAENSVFSADCSILGGFQNTIFNKIGTTFSAIVQGQSNSIYRDYSFIGAGRTNVSSGRFSAIIGGESNLVSGDYTFAAGVKSRAIHPGAFVLSDSRDMIKNSPTGDSLSLYFQSGVYVTGGAGADLYVEGRVIATKLRLSGGNVPISTNSAGTKGEITYDNNYLYCCVQDGSWRRVGWSTF